MKKLLILLFAFISIALQATTYYIDPAGTDGAGVAGGIATPWKTLYYACTRVTTSGDIIHVNAGTYNEGNTTATVSAGVSIEGVGVTSYIISNYTTSYRFAIELKSASEGVNGNQHISGIRLNGQDIAYGAIGVTARSNVHVYDCTIENFNYKGVLFCGRTNWTTSPPTTYATGNKFYNNIVNSTKDGGLAISGQDGMLIYRNTITQSVVTAGIDCYPIKASHAGGYLKNVKIYENNIIAPQDPAVGYMFAIEYWNILGGCELYNNHIHGCIDVGGAQTIRGTSSYSLKIYDNFIGWDSQVTSNEVGIHLEAARNAGGVTQLAKMKDIYIYNNNMPNLYRPIYITGDLCDTMANFYIYNNLFTNVGINTAVNSNGWGMRIDIPAATVVRNWYVQNNTFTARLSGGGQGTTMWGLQIPVTNDSRNINYKNNIVKSFGYAPVYMYNTPLTADTVNIMNNVFYLNGNSNNVRGTGVLTNYTNSGVIKLNPYFVSTTDFHLQSTSPAITAGLEVGLTLDYDSVAWENPPSIGAFEYIPPNPPDEPSTSISTSNILTKSATLSGVITDDGGGIIASKGICWALTANPTIASNNIALGSGTGAFSTTVTGLTPGTTYHVRSWCANEWNADENDDVVTYSEDVEFTTLPYMVIGNGAGKYYYSGGKLVIIK